MAAACLLIYGSLSVAVSRPCSAVHTDGACQHLDHICNLSGVVDSIAHGNAAAEMSGEHVVPSLT